MFASIESGLKPLLISEGQKAPKLHKRLNMF
jgi:hypothetical protein